MNSLTVLYDANCQFCRRIKAWLDGQAKYVDLRFVAAGSERARRCYPELDPVATFRELHVVGEAGEVYRGGKAWLMCLWALREYRGWSLRLGSPELMPFALRLIARVSSERHRFSYRSVVPNEP